MDNLITDGYITIPNLLTLDECQEFCQWIDELFSDEPELDGLEIEGYDRLKIRKHGLSKLVSTRLSEKLQLGPTPDSIDENKHIIVFTQWFPTKYISGGGLGIHIDGNATEDNKSSTHTILIYLNAAPEFTGGRTVFVDDYDSTLEVLCNNYITPTPGLALILEQDKLHFAESLQSGTKYILRGDICYESYAHKLC
jgi:hypothetical protein